MQLLPDHGYHLDRLQGSSAHLKKIDVQSDSRPTQDLCPYIDQSGFNTVRWLWFRHAVKTLGAEPELIDRFSNPADVIQLFPNPLQVLRSGSHAKS
jgi:hypothetical protein